VPPQVLADRAPILPNSGMEDQTLGRDLFAAFRNSVGRADHGAAVL